MGASTFFTVESGTDAADAFRRARDHAEWQHGHGGYTGTIAEKDEYVVIKDQATGLDAIALAEKLIEDDDKRITAKWGPAGAIKMDDAQEGRPERWLFFGWASS